MAVPILNTKQPFQTYTTQTSTSDVGENNFNAIVSIIKMLPLLYLGLQIISHYFWPTPINANILPLTPNLTDTLTQTDLTQTELPVDPPQGSQAPSTAPAEITATLGTVNQNPPI
jgi:hypothetical protein